MNRETFRRHWDKLALIAVARVLDPGRERKAARVLGRQPAAARGARGNPLGRRALFPRPTRLRADRRPARRGVLQRRGILSPLLPGHAHAGRTRHLPWWRPGARRRADLVEL